jgi:hypothetical protein
MIINLTQHEATADQIAAGVVDLPEGLRRKAKEYLDFADAPEDWEIEERADRLVFIVHAFCDSLDVDSEGMQVMIGGAGFLMGDLEAMLIQDRLEPVYAFSKRTSVDVPQADGSVRKVSEFRHIRFVRKYREMFS